MIKELNSWQKREALGRNIVEKYFNSIGVGTHPARLNECWDVIITDVDGKQFDTPIPVEVKTRDTSYPDYLIERAKFDNIFKYGKSDWFLYAVVVLNKILFYAINRNDKLNWTLKICPFASCKGGCNKYVSKDVAFLPVELALEVVDLS